VLEYWYKHSTTLGFLVFQFLRIFSKTLAFFFLELLIIGIRFKAFLFFILFILKSPSYLKIIQTVLILLFNLVKDKHYCIVISYWNGTISISTRHRCFFLINCQILLFMMIDIYVEKKSDNSFALQKYKKHFLIIQIHLKRKHNFWILFLFCIIKNIIF